MSEIFLRDECRCRGSDSIKIIEISFHLIFKSLFSSAYDYIVPAQDKLLAKTDLQIALPDGCYGRVGELDYFSFDPTSVCCFCSHDIGISTLVGYWMLKPSLLNSSGTFNT